MGAQPPEPVLGAGIGALGCWMWSLSCVCSHRIKACLAGDSLAVAVMRPCHERAGNPSKDTGLKFREIPKAFILKPFSPLTEGLPCPAGGWVEGMVSAASPETHQILRALGKPQPFFLLPRVLGLLGADTAQYQALRSTSDLHKKLRDNSINAVTTSEKLVEV